MELGRDALRTLGFRLPKLSEQARIVSYLRTTIDRIDDLVYEYETFRRLSDAESETRLAATLIGGCGLPLGGDVLPCGTPTPIDWLVVSLRQMNTQVYTGPFGTAFSADEYVQGAPIPMINPTHIRKGLLIPDEESRVTEEIANRLSRHRLRTGDIVLGRKGDVGRSALIASEQDGWLCGSDSIAIRVDQTHLSFDYLAWLLRLSVIRQQLEATRLVQLWPT